MPICPTNKTVNSRMKLCIVSEIGTSANIKVKGHRMRADFCFRLTKSEFPLPVIVNRYPALQLWSNLDTTFVAKS
jgi:hypothetical protein